MAPSGGQYIGSSVDIKARWRAHKYELKNNKHFSRALQRAYHKYGFETFTFSVLMFCREEDLILNETMFIEKFKPRYNSRPTVENQRGFRHSEESKKKMSESNKGRGLGVRRPPEVCEKIGAAQRGVKRGPFSPERLVIHSAALKGSKHRDSFRASLNLEKVAEVIAEYAKAGMAATAKKYKCHHRVLKAFLVESGVEVKTWLPSEPKPIKVQRVGPKKLSQDEIDRRQKTRRENAEKRGFWCSDEQKLRISVSTTGKKKKPGAARKRVETIRARRELERIMKEAT